VLSLTYLINPSNSYLLMPGTYKNVRMYPYFGTDLLDYDNLLNISFKDSSK